MGTLLDHADTITLNFVLKTGVDALKALGIRTSYRGAKQAKAVQARYVGQAEEIGRDAFRLGRTDRDDTPLPDSGRLMFGREDAAGEAFTFGQLVDDLAKAGFHLVDFNLLQEDNRDRLFINFKREGEPIKVQDSLSLAVFNIIDGWWANLRGFRNPDRRWNLNVSGRLRQDQVASTADKKIVRMEKDGVFRLIQVREPAAKAAAQTAQA